MKRMLEAKAEAASAVEEKARLDSLPKPPIGNAQFAIKLTGAVSGKPPFVGVLKHRGWRVRDLSLPSAMEGHDATVVAAAEVEL